MEKWIKMQWITNVDTTSFLYTKDYGVKK